MGHNKYKYITRTTKHATEYGAQRGVAAAAVAVAVVGAAPCKLTYNNDQVKWVKRNKI